MGTERLAVEFEREDDGSVMLRVNGKLERGTAALLDGILRAVGRPLARDVDLTGVDHIDSRGLDMLLGAEADARDRPAPVEVIGVRESLRPAARRSKSGQYSRYARQTLYSPYTARPMKASQRIAPSPPPSSHIRRVATSVIAASASAA